MARAAPRAAMDHGISGTTILFCTVLANGELTGCRIVSEDPAGWDFGRASLSIVPIFRMNPTKSDGSSVEGETVKFPIRFVSPFARR
jgi:protein TonB